MSARRINIVLWIVLGILVLAAASVLLAIMSWRRDFRIPLPKGYELFQYSGNEVGLHDAKGNAVLNPIIDSYAVVGDLVIGHVTKARSGWGSVPGYFIVDTHTGAFKSGLKKEQWQAVLLKHGVERLPTLKRPTLDASEAGNG